MFFCCDDVGAKYQDQLSKLDELKVKNPRLKINCFVIAKDIEDWFGKWYLARKEWVELGVHGYEHDYPPECEREDKKERIEKSLNILRQYLPEKFGFRPPGFQMTATTYPILKELGFWFIAHQTKIQPLKETFYQQEIFNCHIYDKLGYAFPKQTKFNLISSGFNNNAGQVQA